jgi:hypothetical protein
VITDEFYIGYETEVPPLVAARVRRVVGVLVAVVQILAVVVLVFQERLLPSRFDFGRPQEVRGQLRRSPYPSLALPDRRVWLVGQGKRGADVAIVGTPDGHVRLQGATIARGRHEMLEVVPGSVVPIEAPATPFAGRDLGRDGWRADAREPGEEVTLTGEIVDSKCFLGVMNPGEGTVHRDCARLCLRGGIPPMLLVRSNTGDDALILLVTADGQAAGPALAHLAGQAVTVTGRLSRGEGSPVLQADPAAYRRAPAP